MISIFDLFKIGIGPSSSHTVGPMKAAAAFVAACDTSRVERVRVTLFGSLAWTGKGHGTAKAVMLGLTGIEPAVVDPDAADRLVAQILVSRRLSLGGRKAIAFDPETDIVFDGVSATPAHPNTLCIEAFDATDTPVASERWCSIGGGFIVPESQVGQQGVDEAPVPYPFRTAR